MHYARHAHKLIAAQVDVITVPFPSPRCIHIPGSNEKFVVGIRIYRKECVFTGIIVGADGIGKQKIIDYIVQINFRIDVFHEISICRI